MNSKRLFSTKLIILFASISMAHAKDIATSQLDVLERSFANAELSNTSSSEFVEPIASSDDTSFDLIMQSFVSAKILNPGKPAPSIGLAVSDPTDAVMGSFERAGLVKRQTQPMVLAIESNQLDQINRSFSAASVFDSTVPMLHVQSPTTQPKKMSTRLPAGEKIQK